MIDTTERKERFIAVAVATGQDPFDPARSLEELAELVDTAGGEVVYSVIQNMSSPSSATYVGSGKVEELRLLLDANEADGIVCDDELAPAQMANLERALQTKVLDRTMVILDIFAAHATTREGKIQVEMAQLPPCHVWVVESVQEDRVRRSWRRIEEPFVTVCHGFVPRSKIWRRPVRSPVRQDRRICFLPLPLWVIPMRGNPRS